MENVKITAVAIDKKTRCQIGESRTENINIKKNELFSNCLTTEDIKNTYESYWNDIGNADYLVVVLDVIY